MHLRKAFVALMLVAFLVGYLPARAAAQANGPRFEPAPCPFSVPAGETIQCGYVSVPENRAAPEGRSIRLAVAVVRSHAEQRRAADPVVFLHGGPAVPILFQLPELLAVFGPVLAERDMVFFDQRGVGYSEPALSCPEFTAETREAAQQDRPPGERQARLLEAATACRDRLTRAGIDLSQYTSAISAADAAEVRAALGYGEWNIYAGSYGTRVALEVLRTYPGGVRSAILDSPVPPQANLLENMPGDIQQGFENLFQRCAADWGCRLAYPNLEAVFRAEVARLNARPAVVTLAADGSAATRYRLSGNDLIDTLYNGLLARQILPFLPAIVYEAREGRYERFAQLRALNERLGEQFALGAYLSTTCSEEVPFNSAARQAAVQPVFQDYLDHYRTINGAFIYPLCRAWPTRPPAATDSLAVSSEVPTLVLAGELDPLTPPAQAGVTAATLSRAFVYTFPGLAHGVLTSPCAMGMAAGFLNNPVQAPEASCIGQLDASPVFFIRAEAARPVAQLLVGLLSLSLGAVFLRRLVTRQPTAGGLELSALAVRFSQRGYALLALGATVFFWAVGAPEGVDFLARGRLIATIVPLFAGLQAAALFSPEDEPALEVTLACPRPLAWTILERLAALLGVQGGLALVGSLLINVPLGEAVGVAVLRWLPAMVCLAGVALCLTLNSRQAVFSAGATVLVWFGFAWGGDRLVEVWPVLWPLHLFLQPEHPFFWLNRGVLTLLGLNLLAFAVTYLIRDEERLLFGDSRAPGRKGAPAAQRQPGLGWRQLLAWRVQNLALLQFLGLIRYEFLLHWRRRALAVLFLASMSLPLLGIFLARNHIGSLDQLLLPAAGLGPEAARQASTASLLMLTWAPLFMVLLMLLPPVAAETVPRDEQLGVGELLHSLPLSPGVYLGGKLAGLWVSLLAGIAGGLGVVGGVWWFGVGPFDLGVYVQMLALGALPVAGLNSGLSMLLAANQPNRRRAIGVGTVFSVVCLFGLALTIRADASAVAQVLSPSHTALFTYFLWGWSGATTAAIQTGTWGEVVRDLGIGVVQLGGVGLVAWGWMRRRFAW